MRRKLGYHEARKLLAHHLLRNAEAHEMGLHNYLDDGFETVDRGLPREGYPDLAKLLVALELWRGWIDASRRQWHDRRGIREEDWGRLARTVVAALEADVEIDDPEVLAAFGPRFPVRRGYNTEDRPSPPARKKR
jgi:hypothetical protein